LNATRRLRAEKLVKKYGRREVVKDVDLLLESGEVVGLLGPNGAGKTTTFYMIVGMIRPDGGSIYVDDDELTGKPMHVRARKGIGYLSQESSIFRNMTVEENIMAILETMPYSGAERVVRLDELLGELDLRELAKARATTLSGGERRRVEITRALVTQPSFLLLDEPFAGIDPIAVADIQEIIFRLKSQRDIGILVTDHNVRETLSVVDRAYIMYEGKILMSGNATELATSREARRVYLGEKFRL
jgi:lipopolysaccharide export system ATP-binding protein